MKILAPVNNPKEVKRIIQAGADEIYCGILPGNWLSTYSNVASPNRREWKTANLNTFSALRDVVDIAHNVHIPVNLALNALYTESQYPLVLEQVEQARKIGVDALIVADLGLLLTLKKEKIDIDVHISTGGTTFNSYTAKFYEEFGASRIVLPRHLQIREMAQLVKSSPSIKFEVFIMNSGCKNIDGFCTFQHGINEILHRQIWNVPKKFNFDRRLLNIIRRLPEKLTQGIKADIFGIDSACLLNYRVSFVCLPENANRAQKKYILKNISSCFSLFSGIDPCGVCRLAELKEIGVYGVKIVGRNYSTTKKISDIKFLKDALSHIENQNYSRAEFGFYVKDVFRKIYKMDCRNLCYYPDGM